MVMVCFKDLWSYCLGHHHLPLWFVSCFLLMMAKDIFSHFKLVKLRPQDIVLHLQIPLLHCPTAVGCRAHAKLFNLRVACATCNGPRCL